MIILVEGFIDNSISSISPLSSSPLSCIVYATKRGSKVSKNVSFSNDDDDTDEAGSRKPKTNGQGKSCICSTNPTTPSWFGLFYPT